MMNLWEKIKTYRESEIAPAILLGVLGTLALLALFFLCVHEPLQGAAGKYQQAAVRDAGEIARIGNFQNAHMQRQEFMAELAQRQTRAFKALPEDLDQSGFIAGLERLAQASRMQLVFIRPQKAVSSGERLCLPVLVRLQGDYFALLKFLRGLQGGERLVLVKSMALQVKQVGALEADLELHIFAVPAK